MNNTLEKQILKELYKLHNWLNINIERRLYKFTTANLKIFSRIMS